MWAMTKKNIYIWMQVKCYVQYSFKDVPSLRERPFNLKGGLWFFFYKNIVIPNVAEKNILILVEEKKIM
jgi:hypothetical protein